MIQNSQKSNRQVYIKTDDKDCFDCKSCYKGQFDGKLVMDINQDRSDFAKVMCGWLHLRFADYRGQGLDSI